MGVSYDLIATMLGHKTEAMAKHYSKRADVSKKLSSTIVELDAEWNRREREMSNQQENNVKPERMWRKLQIILQSNQENRMVPGDGFEPPTRGFSIRCSTN